MKSIKLTKNEVNAMSDVLMYCDLDKDRTAQVVNLIANEEHLSTAQAVELLDNVKNKMLNNLV